MVTIIPLVGSQYAAMIDDDDAERCSYLVWRYTKRGSRRVPMSGSIQLDHFILRAPNDLVVRHLNGNGLDCRRENLRVDPTGHMTAFHPKRER